MILQGKYKAEEAMHTASDNLEKIQATLRLAHARLEKSQADADHATVCALKAESEAEKLRSAGELDRATGESVIASQNRSKAQKLQQEVTAAGIQCEELRSQEIALLEKADAARDNLQSASLHSESLAGVCGAFEQVRQAASQATDLHRSLQAAKVVLDGASEMLSRHQQQASDLLEQAQLAASVGNQDLAADLRHKAAEVAENVPSDHFSACKADFDDACSNYRHQLQCLDACLANISALKSVHESMEGSRSMAAQAKELEQRIVNLEFEHSKIRNELEQQQAELEDAKSVAQELMVLPEGADTATAQEDAERWSARAAACTGQIQCLLDALSNISSNLAESQASCKALEEEQCNSTEVIALLKEITQATQAGVDAISAKAAATSKLQELQRAIQRAQLEVLRRDASKVSDSIQPSVNDAETLLKECERRLNDVQGRLGSLDVALALLLNVHRYKAAFKRAHQRRIEAETAHRNASDKFREAKARASNLEAASRRTRRHCAALKSAGNVQSKDVEAAELLALQAGKDVAAAAAERSVAAESLRSAEAVLQDSQEKSATAQFELMHGMEELQEAQRRLTIVDLRVSLEKQRQSTAAEIREHTKIAAHSTEAASKAASSAVAARDMEVNARKEMEEAQSKLQGLCKSRSSMQQVCGVTLFLADVCTLCPLCVHFVLN